MDGLQDNLYDDDNDFVTTGGSAVGDHFARGLGGNGATVAKLLPFTVFDPSAEEKGYNLLHDLPDWVAVPNGNTVLAFNHDYSKPTAPVVKGATFSAADDIGVLQWLGGTCKNSPAQRLRNFTALVSKNAYNAFVGTQPQMPIRVHAVNMPREEHVGVLSPTVRGQINTQAAFALVPGSKRPLYVINGVTQDLQTGLLVISIGMLL